MIQKLNLYNVFTDTVEHQPDHMACLDFSKNDMCSYKALQERIDVAAKNLEKAGVHAGMCIGLHCASGLEYVIWAYAIWKCGSTIVPIAVELVPEEKIEICKSIHLNGIITAQKDRSLFDELRSHDATILKEGVFFIPIKTSRGHPVEFTDVNAAFIRFTSGTTATSKGVVLSHETVYERIYAANEALHLGPSDIIIWLLSMSYHFTVSIVSYLSFGATFVLCKDQVFGNTIVQTAAKQKATFIYGSPQHYRVMANERSGILLSDLRMAVSTASSLKKETADAFMKRFGIPLTQAYGIIEIGLPCINLDKRTEKRSSVGKPLPAYELRMRDVGFGHDLKAIDFRGKGILDAYYDPWKFRRDIMPDGWFATGDLGRQDEEGFLYILGRSKEMISVAGMKFFPQEVESVLESHPVVKEACVFAEEHERLGEVPHAHVVLKTKGDPKSVTEELREYCLRHLTAFKVPEKIEYVGQLSRTASGKLIRRHIKVNN